MEDLAVSEPKEADVVDPFADESEEETKVNKKKGKKQTPAPAPQGTEYIFTVHNKSSNNSWITYILYAIDLYVIAWQSINLLETETGTVKTKAQKAAEKKERDRKKREQEKVAISCSFIGLFSYW